MTQDRPKTPTPYVPVCPSYLTNSQKLEWHFFAEILASYKIFIPANQNLLNMLAVNNQQYKECLAKVQKMGLFVKGKDGFPVYNPVWTAMNKLEEKILKCLKELGLSSTEIEKRNAAKWR